MQQQYNLSSSNFQLVFDSVSGLIDTVQESGSDGVSQFKPGTDLSPHLHKI